MTTTPSRVTPTSSSSVSTPSASARSKAGSVFSGAWPRAPRWPCRSNALEVCQAICAQNYHRGVLQPARNDARRILDGVGPLKHARVGTDAQEGKYRGPSEPDGIVAGERGLEPELRGAMLGRASVVG